MSSAKRQKSTKSKKAAVPVKDMEPTKDAKGGLITESAQKKEFETANPARNTLAS